MDVVNVLKPGSEMLADLQQEFHTMLDARRKDGRTAIELFCFFEELPVSGVGMVGHVLQVLRVQMNADASLWLGRSCPSTLPS